MGRKSNCNRKKREKLGIREKGCLGILCSEENIVREKRVREKCNLVGSILIELELLLLQLNCFFNWIFLS